MKVCLGDSYGSPLSTTSLTVRGTAPNVDRIQFRFGTTWYDWGDEARSMLRGRRVRLRAVPSAGSWPSGYPRWTASPNDNDDVSIRVDGDKTCVVEYKRISTSTQTTGYKKVTARGADTKEAKAIIGEMGLDKVNFQGNTPIKKDNNTDYPTTEWERGETSTPLCYYGGQTLEAEAFFWTRPNGFDPSGVTVQGKATDATPNRRNPAKFTFPAQAVSQSNGDASYDVRGATEAMESSSNIFDPLRVDWQVQLNGGWVYIGHSSNKLYRTWKRPATTPLYHTVVDVACRNTRGVSGVQTIVEKIWYGVLKSNNVPPANGSDSMRYWGPTATNPGPTGNSSSAYLCANRDGRCGEWVLFMADVLKAHGEEVADAYGIAGVYPPPLPSPPFTPTHWVGIGDGLGANVGAIDGNGGRSLNNLVVKASEAKGGTPSKSYFTNHAVIVKSYQLSSGQTEYKVYDPSYGGDVYVTRNAWEQASIRHFERYLENGNWVETFKVPNNIRPNDSTLQTRWYPRPLPR